MSLNTHQLIGWTAAHQLRCLHEDGTEQSLDLFADNLARIASEDPAVFRTIAAGIERAQKMFLTFNSPDAA